MNLSRIFANAVARRVAYVLVATALAWLGLGEARADTHVSQGEAYTHCMSEASQIVGAESNPPGENKHSPECIGVHNSNNALYGYRACWQGRFYYGAGQWGAYGRMCAGESVHGFSQTCASQPSKPPTTFYPPGGSVGCYDGCQYSYRETGDGETTQRQPNGQVCDEKPDCSALGGNYIWNGYLNVCQPVEPECPEGQKAHGTECVKDDACPDGMALQNGVCKREDDTCPAGNIRSPDGSCLPGEGQCAAGEARRKNGTCGKDADGDGVADDDDDNPDNDTEKGEASGGDSCDAPPSCSGDAIACMQVKIQWRIDCNTRKKANISGGHCGAGGMPVCSGDGCKAAEHQQLIQQWKSACLLEKIAAKDGDSSGGDSSTADYIAATRAADKAELDASAAQGDGHEGVSESTIFKQFDNSSFNPNMFGGSHGGTCSFTAPLELMGRPIDLPPEWWTLASMIGWLVVASAYIWVAVQLGK